jgi:hypothetical protein
MRKYSASRYFEKSNYLAGLGVGIVLASLFLIPEKAASWPHKNLLWLSFGIVALMASGIYGTFGKRKQIKEEHISNFKELKKK